MHITIITGVSRGLGEALARRLLGMGRPVIGIARTDNPELVRFAEQKGAAYAFFGCDLKRAEEVNAVMQRIIGSIEPEQASSITLINNAGVLEPIGPIQDADSERLAEHLQVNLLAPMLLVSAMIRLTEGWTIPRTVASISSGAGKKPYAGWSAYCTAKAGLDMLTRSVGLEQGEGAHAVKLVSIAPGVVDTGMQELIRSTPKERFPEVDRFIGLKQTASLYTPEEAAERIIKLLDSGRFNQGDVLDVRQLDAE